MSNERRAHRFADEAMRATGRGVWSDAEAKAEMAEARACRWCWGRVIANVPCACPKAQEEARRIRNDHR
jgi:hypothetical protein